MTTASNPSTSPSTAAASSSTGTVPTREQADLLETLAKHRHFLRFTVRDLTDEQVALTPTASALCLGGLIKHVTAMEQGWVDFLLEGPAVMEFTGDPAQFEEHAAQFRVRPGETLASILAEYERVTERTDDVIRSTDDFDRSHPLPTAPWFEPGAEWSTRRVFLHLIAETSQHAGHADIIRETIDGAKTMG